MVISTQSRDLLFDELRRELVGPAPVGKEIDCRSNLVFSNKTDSYQPFVQKGSGEEIIQRDSPSTRYGVAALYPQYETDQKKRSAVTDPVKKIIFGDEGEILYRETRDGEVISGSSATADEPKFAELPDSDYAGLDLSSAHKFRQNSMAITFQAEILPDSQLIVSAGGGRYDEFPVKIDKEKVIWSARRPVTLSAKFNHLDKLTKADRLKSSKIKSENTQGLNLAIEAHARPTDQPNIWTITVMLRNLTIVPDKKMPDAYTLFQSQFSVHVVSPSGNRHIVPYQLDNNIEQLSAEEQSLDLLYRGAKPFAKGHGCSADWDKHVEADDRVKQILATHFPFFEVPSMTSEVKGADGHPLEISMAKLGGLIAGDDGLAALDEMLDEYERWINRREIQLAKIPARYDAAGIRHLQSCRQVLARMRDGLDLLQSDPLAYQSFQLANRAMLMQQLRGKRPLRSAAVDQKTGKITFSAPNAEIDLLAPHETLGKWRAFQIAFLLLALRSAIDPDCPDRETVELIWVATGGGKTEAYLLLSAFVIFYRRLCDPQDAGTTVFMRYTLRLLTAQQFQRTGALICAMEKLRIENEHALGDTKISIGLWLGGDVTPNTRHEARRNLEQLRKNPVFTQNKFVVNRCPYCAAEMGKVEQKIKKTGSNNGSSGGGSSSNDGGEHSERKKQVHILGYRHQAGGVALHCPDPSCEFHDELPVYVTDETLYQQRPTLYIGTVDKFAVLAFKPEAKALFGLDPDGRRLFSPPALIIQDELQMIGGPTGTLVAQYEPVIEDLCTDYRGVRATKPKIIASTATTRAYREQLTALFARPEAQLFPPPGLDAGNSFFTRYARDEQGNLLPGRLYVGINAPGLGSMQNMEVRVYTALLQAVQALPEAQRNYYWTLMIFFNNLKWLGNTYSLFQGNLPAYALAYKSRTGNDKIRQIKSPLELTGNLRGDQVLTALKKLEIDWTLASKNAVDACLCSSLVEVGVDVPRLSQMVVVGQPKTTSQYIQVTSRVGRDPRSPGLVVTIYSPGKPRDRSHFENFRSFHERLYAEVEPVSLTPFSPPALERALHGVIAAHVRQTGDRRESLTPDPVPEERLRIIKDILLARVERVDPEMRAEFLRIFEQRIDEWRLWKPTCWTPDERAPDAPALLRSFHGWLEESVKARSWATPISMRSVDAESELRITHYYESVKSAGSTANPGTVSAVLPAEKEETF